MKMNYLSFLKLTCLSILIFSICSCERELSDDAELAGFSKNGEVFIDDFTPGLEYLPFQGSLLDGFMVDSETVQSGSASMQFVVPNVGDPNGTYSGAIFRDLSGRDLSEFDALTFYVRASKSATLNEVGFGLDFLEDAYSVSVNGLDVSTSWKQYTVAIPDPSKLTAESGLFWYAEGPEDGEGYTLWFDQIEFVSNENISQPRPAIQNGDNITISSFVDVNTEITGLTQTWRLENGQDQTVNTSPAYFSFSSSNPSVATVDENGVINAVGEGTAVISATLGSETADGSVTIDVAGAFVGAPNPTLDASQVISIFSDSYSNVPVDYYNGYWQPFQTTTGGQTSFDDDNVLAYSELNFVGIQFIENGPTINASQMTHVHLDIQVKEPVQAGDFLTVRFIDAGPDNTLGTGDETEGQFIIDDLNELVEDQWISIDRTLAEMNLFGPSNLAQLIFVTDGTVSEIFMDNIYLYQGGPVMGNSPEVAAPTPTQPAADVLSIYSDAYSNIGSNLNPDWGQSTQFSEIQIDGNNTIVYGGLNYQGLELGSAQNVTDKDFLHIDFWSANSSSFNVFLISPGPLETGLAQNVPTSGWQSMDIPLSSFSDVDLSEVFQMKFDGNGTIYVDNIYFY